MNDFYVMQLGRLYEKEMASRSIKDYRGNREQVQKFLDAVYFFTECTKDSKHARLESVINPKETVGSITYECYLFDVCGAKAQEFAKVLSWCSAVSIDATADGKAVISMTIPDVFVLRESK